MPLVALLRGPPGGAGWVHRGATSQDLVDTALMLTASATLAAGRGPALAVLAGRLARSGHRTSRCVARTLTQQAMPTTLGFRAAGWLAGVHDALRAGPSLPAAAGVARRPGRHGGGVRRARSGGRRLAGALGRPGAPVMTWHTRRTPVLTLAYRAGRRRRGAAGGSRGPAA